MSVCNVDALLVKYDSSGSMTWAKTLGGANFDYLNSVQETADGGFITGGFGVGMEMLLLKLDSFSNHHTCHPIADSNGYDFRSLWIFRKRR
ncbi:hypothetical protein K8T06_15410 [bacterium]|nr:hypothetical protein [bacterium]